MEGFEETDRIQRSFCKKALRIPTRAAKGKQNWSWVEKIRGVELVRRKTSQRTLCTQSDDLLGGVARDTAVGV